MKRVKKGHSQARLAAVPVCKAAAVRNSARGYVTVLKAQAAQGGLASSPASLVQEIVHQDQRLWVCVLAQNSLSLSIESACILLAKRHRERGRNGHSF